MEWSLDKNKAQTREIWPFKPIGALGTAAAVEAPRGSGGLPKTKMCLGNPIEAQHGGGLPKTPESTIGEEWSPSPLPSVPISDQESSKG